MCPNTITASGSVFGGQVKSLFQVLVNKDVQLKTYNRNWIKTYLIALPPLGTLWILYFTIENKDGVRSPTLISSIILFSGMVMFYFIEMWNNHDFYGTTEFWKKLPVTKKKLQEPENI